MDFFRKHKKLMQILIAIASLALLFTSFAPLFFYLK